VLFYIDLDKRKAFWLFKNFITILIIHYLEVHLVQVACVIFGAVLFGVAEEPAPLDVFSF
jgi:hypothetical protein